MRIADSIPEMKIQTECKLHPGITYTIIVPLLNGRAYGINRCENAAGSNPVCCECAVRVDARAEQEYLQLPDYLK